MWEKPWNPSEDAQNHANYSALPASPPPPNLPTLCKQRKRQFCSPLLIILLLLLLLGSTIFLLWPRKPNIEITEINLQGITLDSQRKNGSLIPTVYLNVSLSLALQIMNPNLFGIDYHQLTVHILYRDNEIGEINSTGRRIAARSITHANASLSLESVQIVEDIPELVKDMAENRLPLDAVTEFDASVEIFFFRPSAEITIDCHFVVDPSNDTILEQNCFLPA